MSSTGMRWVDRTVTAQECPYGYASRAHSNSPIPERLNAWVNAHADDVREWWCGSGYGQDGVSTQLCRGHAVFAVFASPGGIIAQRINDENEAREIYARYEQFALLELQFLAFPPELADDFVKVIVN